MQYGRNIFKWRKPRHFTKIDALTIVKIKYLWFLLDKVNFAFLRVIWEYWSFSRGIKMPDLKLVIWRSTGFTSRVCLKRQNYQFSIVDFTLFSNRICCRTAHETHQLLLRLPLSFGWKPTRKKPMHDTRLKCKNTSHSIMVHTAKPGS